MKTHLFTIALVALAALTHTNYQIAAAAPDPRNPIQSRILHGHTGPVNSGAFSPDGSKIATGSDDGIVRIWDIQSGALLHTLHGHTSWVTSVAFSPDESKLATGALDHTARIWDTLSETLLHTLHGHIGCVASVAFSPDGSKIATGSSDCTARIWHTHSGSLVHTLHGHTNWVNSVAFNPDGSKLATGSSDCTARIWDTHLGTLLHTLHGHTGSIYSIAFSPDGSKLATRSFDHTARIWYDTRTQNHDARRSVAKILLAATYGRIGEHSPVHGHLDEWTIRNIMELARPDSFWPIIEQEHHAPAGEPAPDVHQPAQQQRQGFTRYLPAVAIAVPSIAAAVLLLRHFMHR